MRLHQVNFESQASCSLFLRQAPLLTHYCSASVTLRTKQQELQEPCAEVEFPFSGISAVAFVATPMSHSSLGFLGPGFAQRRGSTHHQAGLTAWGSSVWPGVTLLFSRQQRHYSTTLVRSNSLLVLHGRRHRAPFAPAQSPSKANTKPIPNDSRPRSLGLPSIPKPLLSTEFGQGIRPC